MVLRKDETKELLRNLTSATKEFMTRVGLPMLSAISSITPLLRDVFLHGVELDVASIGSQD